MVFGYYKSKFKAGFINKAHFIKSENKIVSAFCTSVFAISGLSDFVYLPEDPLKNPFRPLAIHNSLKALSHLSW